MPLHDDEIAVGITYADAEQRRWVNDDGWGWRRNANDEHADNPTPLAEKGLDKRPAGK